MVSSASSPTITSSGAPVGAALGGSTGTGGVSTSSLSGLESKEGHAEGKMGGAATSNSTSTSISNAHAPPLRGDSGGDHAPPLRGDSGGDGAGGGAATTSSMGNSEVPVLPANGVGVATTRRIHQLLCWIISNPLTLDTSESGAGGDGDEDEEKVPQYSDVMSVLMQQDDDHSDIDGGLLQGQRGGESKADSTGDGTVGSSTAGKSKARMIARATSVLSSSERTGRCIQIEASNALQVGFDLFHPTTRHHRRLLYSLLAEGARAPHPAMLDAVVSRLCETPRLVSLLAPLLKTKHRLGGDAKEGKEDGIDSDAPPFSPPLLMMSDQEGHCSELSTLMAVLLHRAAGHVRDQLDSGGAGGGGSHAAATRTNKGPATDDPDINHSTETSSSPPPSPFLKLLLAFQKQLLSTWGGEHGGGAGGGGGSSEQTLGCILAHARRTFREAEILLSEATANVVNGSGRGNGGRGRREKTALGAPGGVLDVLKGSFVALLVPSLVAAFCIARAHTALVVRMTPLVARLLHTVDEAGAQFQRHIASDPHHHSDREGQQLAWLSQLQVMLGRLAGRLGCMLIAGESSDDAVPLHLGGRRSWLESRLLCGGASTVTMPIDPPPPSRFEPPLGGGSSTNYEGGLDAVLHWRAVDVFSGAAAASNAAGSSSSSSSSSSSERGSGGSGGSAHPAAKRGADDKSRFIADLVDGGAAALALDGWMRQYVSLVTNEHALEMVSVSSGAARAVIAVLLWTNGYTEQAMAHCQMLEMETDQSNMSKAGRMARSRGQSPGHGKQDPPSALVAIWKAGSAMAVRAIASRVGSDAEEAAAPHVQQQAASEVVEAARFLLRLVPMFPVE